MLKSNNSIINKKYEINIITAPSIPLSSIAASLPRRITPPNIG